MRHAAIGIVLVACTAFDTKPLPAYGEALFVVDTDLPVPAVVSRLRIDVLAEDGTWTTSKDELRLDPRDWPTSFSVFSDDETKPRVAIVRLRAYLDGRTIRYRGRSYAPLPDLVGGRLPPGDGNPRLVENGIDRTPELEPDPVLAVDRVVRVRLTYGTRGRVHVVLGGACVGHMSNLLDPGAIETCVDGVLGPLVDTPLEAAFDRGVPSITGTYARDPCPETRDGERVCVPGGAFVFGDAFFRSSMAVAPIDPRPERIFALSRFMIDREEVSVARFRGFAPPVAIGVTERNGPPGLVSDEACTSSAAPRDREGYALNCVPWESAKAFCVAQGGDLPTEVQWEYAALAAGRATKAIYPWGDDPPSCERAVYGRTGLGPDCFTIGQGAVPLGPADGDNALGIRGLAGGVSELMRDSSARLTSDCWRNAAPLDPTCALPRKADCGLDPNCGPRYAVRGGSWASSKHDLEVVDRSNDTGAKNARSVITGFRCVYSAR